MPPLHQDVIAAMEDGRFSEAEALCIAVLSAAADDGAALLLMGMVKAQQGDLVTALVWLDRAVAASPDHFAGHVARGDILRALHHPEEALASYERASAIQPDHPVILANRGMLARQLGRWDAALGCFDAALRLDADNPALLGNRAIVLAALGRLDAAAAAIDQVARLRPDDPDTLVNRASIRSQQHRWQAALADYDRAVALRPDHAATRVIRAATLLQLKRPAEALADCDLALALRPDDAGALTNRGFALLDLRRAEEALASFERALALRPDHPAAVADRGDALVELGRAEEALAAYDAALRLDPGNAHAFDRRGEALRLLGRPEEALASYRRAAALAPDDAVIQGHLSLCHLLLGQFAEGWPLYEWRWKLPGAVPLAGPEAGPLWLGQDSLRGKTILLLAEQGLGDIIQFCRFVPLVAAQGATVWLTAPPAMLRLLAGLDGVARLLPWDEAFPEADCHCPLMSLPLALGTRLSTIPAPALAFDPAWADASVGAMANEGRFRVGLVWSGNPAHSNDRRRSIPLARFARALVPSVDYFVLQTEIQPRDQRVLDALDTIVVPADRSPDLAATAALIAAMDLVITVDTSVAHLAGTLGKPVWILLAHDPDWRWMLGRPDSPWYPSARLFRQPAPGDWESVLDQVVAALRAMTG